MILNRDGSMQLKCMVSLRHSFPATQNVLDRRGGNRCTANSPGFLAYPVTISDTDVI